MSQVYKVGLRAVDQQYMLDTQFLGSLLLRDEKKLSAFVRRFTDNNSFLNYFAYFGIGSGDSAVPAVSNETVGDSLVRWRVVDNTLVQPTIVANQLPDVVVANTPVPIALDQNWVDKQGLFLAEDGRTVFVVNRRGTQASAPFNYEVSYVSGVKGEVLLRKDLLAVGRRLNYFSNARTEASAISQPIKFSNSGYDMFNVTQTIRHKVVATGHGLSTMIAMDAYSSSNADAILDPENSGYIPFNGSEMIKFHLASVGQTAVFGRTNFDAPNRRVYTFDNDAARPEIPITAGALEQFEWTDSRQEINIHSPIAVLANQIDAYIAARSEYFRDDRTKYVIVTGRGGKAILNKIKEYKHSSKIQFTQEVSTGKINNVGFNYSDAEYYTDFGTFTVLDTGYSSTTRSTILEQTMWNGVMYNSNSFDMYVIPVRVNQDGRRTVRLCTKAANGINRGLVLGSLPGMSGMYNGSPLDLTSIAGKEFASAISAMAMQDRHKIVSAVDGEEYLALSEITVIVECPDDILWIRAQVR